MNTDIKKIGKYEIISTLGEGAMGIVYKGIDPIIERYVAIKTIRHDAPELEEHDIRARFVREAQAAGRLHHPNIVGIYEYGQDADRDFIAMELVEGISLSEHLKRHGRLELAAVCFIMSKVLEALDYAHSMGVIHRDIKPGNIMLADDGGVKVTDFGIARIESSTLTQVGTVVGTPSYMSPEQLLGQSIDHRSDIFAAGTLLYKLLTGEKPFPGAKLTTLVYNIVHREHTLPSSIEPTLAGEFDEIIAKALAKKPENRFQAAKDFATALIQAAEKHSRPRGKSGREGDGTVVRTSYSETAGKSSRQYAPGLKTKATVESVGKKKPMLIIGSALGIIILGAGIVWFFLISDQPRPRVAESVPTTDPATIKDKEAEAAMKQEQMPPSPVTQPPLVSEQPSAIPPKIESMDETAIAIAQVQDRVQAGDSFKDCIDCPEMVAIPSGSFMQGSPPTETERENSEGPQHYVSIEYPLAVARHEITRSEFAQFITETGYKANGCWIYDGQWNEHQSGSWQAPGFDQDDKHPVTCVSWNDAKAYVQWLTKKTQKAYRLLSDSEWEYVARARIEASRIWGNDLASACDSANVADLSSEQHYNGWEVHNCRDEYVHTAPVGSFKPNGFGLYDMLGNAFEWVEDCWNDNYIWGAPLDGSAWIEGDCSHRMLRGGSWFSMPRYVRLAFRNRFDPDYRSSSFGFRVARVLNRGG